MNTHNFLITKDWIKNKYLAFKIIIYIDPRKSFEKLQFFPDKIYLLDCTVKLTKSDLENIAKIGGLSVFEFVYRRLENAISLVNFDLFRTIITYGHLDILIFLYNAVEKLKLPQIAYHDELIKTAAERNKLDILKFLCNKATEIDQIFATDFIALRLATLHEHVRIVKFLCETALKLNKSKKIFVYDFHVLYLARQSRNQELVDYFQSLR